MGQVTVRVNGYGHTIGCKDGEEQNVAALAAQIVGRDPQAHRVELADSLEIFLDELIAPLQQHDRAAGW